jgi:peptidoglycan/xylan/chitin deacetylase (PgdA/CDA1 family)
LVGIGPHTVTHPALTELDPLASGREIAASKKVCEALAGAEVRSFAYPFGSLNTNVRAAVANAGFTCACSTRHAAVTFSSDVFALPRIQVLDSGGEAFERTLRHVSIAP